MSGDDLHFLQLLKPLAYVLDPRRPESLTAICRSPAGLNRMQKVPIDLILTPHSAQLIRDRRYSELPELFRILCAEAGEQQAAFRGETILLNCWELFCMVLMKHLASLPSVDSFYRIDDDGVDISSRPHPRSDDARLSLVIFVKVLEYCQAVKLEAGAGFDE